MSKGRKPRREPALGSAAFGADAGRPTGAAAVGGEDSEHPLRGARSVGVDAAGGPTGSEAFGGSEPARPLKGAIVIGNDPQGNPTGAAAVGGPEQAVPLKGAILIGNDPAGWGTGSAAFGTPDARLPYRGAEAVGAPQLVPERLSKDALGYDFQSVILRVDDTSLAGARKDPADRVRQRVLGILARTLGCEPERLRHGLGEDAIPWGRLRRSRTLDRELATLLRSAYQKAPNGVLGIGHVRDLLHASGRMHTVSLSGDWDTPPLRLVLAHDGAPQAYALSSQHKEHCFFLLRDPQGEVLAYVDTLTPRLGVESARARDGAGKLLASLALRTPAASQDVPADGPPRLVMVVRADGGEPLCEIREERVAPRLFAAQIVLPDSEDVVGSLGDQLEPGGFRAQIDLDLRVSRVVAYAMALVTADLARRRRQGWPAAPAAAGEEEPVEDVERALGPRRRRRT